MKKYRKIRFIIEPEDREQALLQWVHDGTEGIIMPDVE